MSLVPERLGTHHLEPPFVYKTGQRVLSKPVVKVPEMKTNPLTVGPEKAKQVWSAVLNAGGHRPQPGKGKSKPVGHLERHGTLWDKRGHCNAMKHCGTLWETGDTLRHCARGCRECPVTQETPLAE